MGKDYLKEAGFKPAGGRKQPVKFQAEEFKAKTKSGKLYDGEILGTVLSRNGNLGEGVYIVRFKPAQPAW